ncbi:hypothetical protein AB0M95_22355 [Sphaerisporangium sp. NPDC051017]|uniref:hypothetical protein n=1 Tax=Sphaerisporangium sp. NPDC051017 TaxID=3154636 RepID=UPI0034308878
MKVRRRPGVPPREPGLPYGSVRLTDVLPDRWTAPAGAGTGLAPGPAPAGRPGLRGSAMQKFSLVAVGRLQMNRAADSSGGHAADTVVGGHERVLRQTVIALVRGAKMKDFENPGEGSFHVLQGRIRVSARGTSWDVLAGDLLELPESRQSVEALEDSVLLFTVAKTG